MKPFILLSLVAAVCAEHEFRIQNACSYTIWPGFLNNPNNVLPEQGGFELAPGQTRTVMVPDKWAGRMWGRTGCNAQGQCETGNCGKIQCSGAGGATPASLAEFTLGGFGEQDYYDVSLVDGYNLPMSIIPIDGTFKKGSDANHYDCNVAGCKDDLNNHCPAELQVKNAAGKVIACNSACSVFKSDDYCCRGAHDRPETCKSKDWKVNYPATFKQACPDAYSYAYDDLSSTFICHGNPHSGYIIKFCP